MGSMIYLRIGDFEVDWGKNNSFAMHGELFQPGDLKAVPYYYVGDEEERVVEMKEGVARPLASTVGRLELLGYTIDGTRRAYQSLVADMGLEKPPISFDLLADALVNLDVETKADYDTEYDFGEFFGREVFKRLKLQSHGVDEAEARFGLGQFMENLSPYAILRLLAENPANAAKEVMWAFADVVENGWADRDAILRELGAQRKFLIVTEGSSDASVLKGALKLLRPDVADFFYFVDMQEGYPFTGTGNLHRFCQGLASIGIENRVVVVYDNDAEGSARFTDTSKLRLPPNMRVMRLPDHETFKTFPTIGPRGEGNADINGCAAAIECYLDLTWEAEAPPLVRWTSYNSVTGAYQGELVGKQAYAHRFFELRSQASGYDFSKLDMVLKALLSECVAMAVMDLALG